MNVANERDALGAEFLETRGEITEKAPGFGGVGETIGANIDAGSSGIDTNNFAQG